MVDIVEILVHWYAGRPVTEVAESLGVDRKTVRKYVAKAKAAGISPGVGHVMSRRDWAALVREWFPEIVDVGLRSDTFVECDRYRDLVRELLEAGCSVSTIWQRLADEHGLGASRRSLGRYVDAALSESKRSRVTVRKPVPPPGAEGQVDYAYLGEWYDPSSGKRRRVWAFLLTLGASRHMFVRPVVSMNQSEWIRAHVEAFTFFGGAPRRIVSDNLKTGVIKADWYDPKLNVGYAELAQYYGVLIDPARAAKPKDKPLVERMVQYCRDSFWRGRRPDYWFSLADMQQHALDWCTQIAGNRACRPLGGARPLQVFKRVEASALLALPAEPYEVADWSRVTVGRDSHISVGGSLYSVPFQYLGDTVDARLSDKALRVYIEGDLIKTHLRVIKGQRQTDLADYPPEKVAFLQQSPQWCQREAAKIGAACYQSVTELLASQTHSRLRQAQRIVALKRRYGPQRLDQACDRAIAAGDPTYRTIKGILAANLENDSPLDQPSISDTPAYLHGPEGLFHVNNRSTGVI